MHFPRYFLLCERYTKRGPDPALFYLRDSVICLRLIALVLLWNLWEAWLPSEPVLVVRKGVLYHGIDLSRRYRKWSP